VKRAATYCGAAARHRSRSAASSISRPIADTVEAGDLRFDGDPQAISGLTSLLQALTSSP